MKKDNRKQFTLENAQIFYQTLADIMGEKNNIKIIAKVKEKEKEST